MNGAGNMHTKKSASLKTSEERPNIELVNKARGCGVHSSVLCIDRPWIVRYEPLAIIS
jgi:hypothetical protein